jgi:glycosyltransferase involved in cell wall biosynthesis
VNGEQLWVVDHAPVMGGAELFILKLARHAAAGSRARVVVVCPAASELADRCRAAGIEVRAAAMPHFTSAQAARIPAAVLRLARVLRRAPPGATVVASSAWSQALVAACVPLLSGRPVVHLLHEQDTAKRRSARIVLARTGLPVAIGANAVATYVAALGGAPVAQINNVLGDAELAAAAVAPRRAPGARREAATRPVVGVLARLIPEKGIVEFVEELSACHHAWHVAHIAGGAQDASYAARVARRISALGLADRIALRGHVGDVAAFLDGLDVLIVPSIGTEGQPTVVLEALARGVDVVVRTDVFSADYSGLPVAAYRDGADLRAALGALPGTPAPLDELARRFGAGQALDGLLAGALARRR